MLFFATKGLKMKKFLAVFVFSVLAANAVSSYCKDNSHVVESDVDKILKAKEIVRAMVNYPDTLVFHEFSTKVSGNTVTLTFTCKNGYGVPETHTKDIKVK